MSGRYYLTTAIPYVNAKPHLGHALEFVEADALVRAKRLLLGDNNVYFLSGTDENALKNVQAAEAAGMRIEDFVKQNSDAFSDLLRKLNIHPNDFIRTTEERHKQGAQALWRTTNPKDIYKKSYSGLYCVGCEQFYKPEDLLNGTECYEHPGKPLEMVAEENYFFRLSEYGPWLKEIISSGELSVIPETRRNEMLALIDRGLEDFSISRPTSRTKGWGVQVPGDESQTMYVWYDALANYITALGYPEKTKLYSDFWENNPDKGHVIGKGINRFHTLYWPAMLKSAGLPLPKFVYVHGYITVDGEKMSKSTGNVVDPEELIEEYGADAVRFYLLGAISSKEDGDFSAEKMRIAYNAYLANGLGNLTSRVLKMAAVNNAWPENLNSSNQDLEEKVKDYLDKFEPDKALREIWTYISAADLLIQKEEPFKKIKTEPENAKATIEQLVVELWRIASNLQPFLPQTSASIITAIGKREVPPILFPRIS